MLKIELIYGCDRQLTAAKAGQQLRMIWTSTGRLISTSAAYVGMPSPRRSEAPTKLCSMTYLVSND